MVVTAAADALKLMIVEDDPDQRDLIRETLEDHFGPGTVSAVGSVAAALAVDVAAFHLILTDYNLSDGCGMDLLDEVRRRCDTPVVMLTGVNVGRIAADAVRHGATDYVVKAGALPVHHPPGDREEPGHGQGRPGERPPPPAGRAGHGRAAAEERPAGGSPSNGSSGSPPPTR